MDLIERQAAIDAIEKTKTAVSPDGERYVAKINAQMNVQLLPSAKPEIIRCKDCKQFRRWIDTKIVFCDRTELEVSSDDFCSRAERREDG